MDLLQLPNDPLAPRVRLFAPWRWFDSWTPLEKWAFAGFAVCGSCLLFDAPLLELLDLLAR